MREIRCNGRSITAEGQRNAARDGSNSRSFCRCCSAILFGTLDLGRAFYTYIGLTNAAREAARYAAVNDSSASITQVQQELNSGGSDISGCAAGTLTYSATGGGARGTDYTVNVSCQFTLVTPFMSSILGATDNEITIHSTATFVLD